MLAEDLIKKNLNEQGKLTCKDAYKVSAISKVHINKIGEIAKSMGVRISDCELGQFGKLDKSQWSDKAKENLKKIVDKYKRVTCKQAREAAKGVGFKKIRGALKKEDIDVLYCELGCFTQKKGRKLKIKTKTWIEDGESNLLFGKGKTEVLELIDKTGSISGASKELGMNYKKTWTHIKILENNFHHVMVESKQGGSGSGGTVLTDVARETIEKYRQLEQEINDFANERFKELFLKPRNKDEKR